MASLATIANLASAVATIVLVMLTAWYAYETRRMVQQESELRRRESMENWYSATLPIARKMEQSWTKEFATEAEEDGEDTFSLRVVIAKRVIFKEGFREHIQDLRQQSIHRPAGIDSNLSKAIAGVIARWNKISRQEIPVGIDDELYIRILQVKAYIDEDSNHFDSSKEFGTTVEVAPDSSMAEIEIPREVDRPDPLYVAGYSRRDIENDDKRSRDRRKERSH